MPLDQKHCLPCTGSIEPLSPERVGEYLPQVPDWSLDESGKRIMRQFKFQDFKEALAFVNRVGELAESEGHHPDIAIHWNRVTLELWTHVAKGLTKNDFILAAKIDALLPYIQEQGDDDGEKGSDA